MYNDMLCIGIYFGIFAVYLDMMNLQILTLSDEALLRTLDIGLYLLHLLIIGFNLTGWIWPKTRRLHLWSLGATILSWCVLGYWFGFGYCVITDWQWQLKGAMGQEGLPPSFIDHLLNDMIGVGIDPVKVDILTGGLFVLVIILAVALKLKDQKNKSREGLITGPYKAKQL